MSVVNRHLQIPQQTSLEHRPLAEPPPDFFYTVIQLFCLLHSAHIRKEVNLFRHALGNKVDGSYRHRTDWGRPAVILLENFMSLFGYHHRTLGRQAEWCLKLTKAQVVATDADLNTSRFQLM